MIKATVRAVKVGAGTYDGDGDGKPRDISFTTAISRPVPSPQLSVPDLFRTIPIPQFAQSFPSHPDGGTDSFLPFRISVTRWSPWFGKWAEASKWKFFISKWKLSTSKLFFFLLPIRSSGSQNGSFLLAQGKSDFFFHFQNGRFWIFRLPNGSFGSRVETSVWSMEVSIVKTSASQWKFPKWKQVEAKRKLPRPCPAEALSSFH